MTETITKVQTPAEKKAAEELQAYLSSKKVSVGIVHGHITAVCEKTGKAKRFQVVPFYVQPDIAWVDAVDEAIERSVPEGEGDFWWVDIEDHIDIEECIVPESSFTKAAGIS